MATSPDLHSSIVPAVLEWVTPTIPSTATATPSVPSEGKRCIARPDPQSAVILFELVCPSSKSSNADVQDQSSPLDVFFQLRIPIKLKYPVGRTHVHVSIHPSRIAALSFTADIEAQENVSDKLPGRLARLTFTMREPVHVIIPANTPISLLPAGTRASGEILDAMQSLGRATSLSIVMPAAQAPRRKLEPLCAALADGGRGLNPLPRYKELRSLFGGTGGQILELSPPPAPSPSREGVQDEDVEAGPSECPPVYAEVGPGPPMPPISAEPDAKDAKRRRSSNSSNASHTSSPSGADQSQKRRRLLKPDLPLPTAGSSKEQQDMIMDAMAQRLMAVFETRFNEQNRVIEAQGELIARLQKHAREQDDRIEELESDLAEAKQDLLQAWDKIEGLDVDVAELDENAQEVEQNVKYWTEDGWDELKLELEEAVTGAVLDAVTDRIAEEGLRAHSVNFTWTNE